MVESTILTPEVITLITTLVSFVIGMIVKRPEYKKAKTQIATSNQFLTEIDEALYDDEISEEEFRRIFDAGKRMMDRSVQS